MKVHSRFTARRVDRESSRKVLRTIVMGNGALARHLVRAIKDHGNGGYELLGAVANTRTAADEEGELGCRVLGPIWQLEKILAVLRPDCVIVATKDGAMEIMERLLHFLMHSDVPVIPAVEVYEALTGQVPIETLTPDDLVFRQELRPRLWQICINRGISIFLAILGAILTAPLMAVIAVAIKLDSRGPAIFLQDRAGLNGRRFGLLKFRTMRHDTAERSVWAAENADRITRIGEWLRKFRLDELPQLLNVLKGDMNIVGPRPHPSSSSEMVELISRNVAECGVAMPYYTMRSMVRPGITGWAQVRYKYANGLGEELEKLRYDLYYVKHYSVRLDLRILIMTIAVVARGGGHGRATPRTEAPMGVNKDAPLAVLPLSGREQDGTTKIGTNGAVARALLSGEGEKRSGAGR